MLKWEQAKGPDPNEMNRKNVIGEIAYITRSMGREDEKLLGKSGLRKEENIKTGFKEECGEHDSTDAQYRHDLECDEHCLLRRETA
jgi:hypothetical protein